MRKIQQRRFRAPAKKPRLNLFSQRQNEDSTGGALAEQKEKPYVKEDSSG